jgi:two-component system sensor histidine kinase/response regulator
VSVVVDGVRATTILVVDVRPGNIQNIRLVFGKLGYEIIPAANIRAALEQISARCPDLILLDLVMPGDAECDFCRQLKANPDWKDIPVIFLSAVDDKDIVSRALTAGGADYITKPFSRAELISRVRTHLALKISSDRLKELAQEKEELIGMLAHSLKNYLGGINLSADLMRGRSERLKDVRLRELAEKMIDSSSSALALVKTFLNRAAVDYGSVPKQSAAVAPANTIAVPERRSRKAVRRKQGGDRSDSKIAAVTSFSVDPDAKPKTAQTFRISA